MMVNSTMERNMDLVHRHINQEVNMKENGWMVIWKDKVNSLIKKE